MFLDFSSCVFEHSGHFWWHIWKFSSKSSFLGLQRLPSIWRMLVKVRFRALSWRSDSLNGFGLKGRLRKSLNWNSSFGIFCGKKIFWTRLCRSKWHRVWRSTLESRKKNCCTQISNFCHVLCMTSQDGVSKNLITCRILSRRPLELGVSWLR